MSKINVDSQSQGTKLDRQTLQYVVSLMHQYGIFHGLLAGLTALIRGAYESEGLYKSCLDALLCCLIGTFVLHLPFVGTFFTDDPYRAYIAATVIGIVGANLIITTVRDSFIAALKQLNPLTWFKKAR